MANYKHPCDGCRYHRVTKTNINNTNNTHRCSINLWHGKVYLRWDVEGLVSELRERRCPLWKELTTQLLQAQPDPPTATEKE